MFLWRSLKVVQPVVGATNFLFSFLCGVCKTVSWGLANTIFFAGGSR